MHMKKMCSVSLVIGEMQIKTTRHSLSQPLGVAIKKKLEGNKSWRCGEIGTSYSVSH